MALVELGRFSNGVEAVCFDAGMNIAESVGIMIPVRLMVDEDDLDAARAVIREAEAQ